MHDGRATNPAISRNHGLIGGLRRRGRLAGVGGRHPAVRRAARSLLVLALLAGSLVSLASVAAAQEPTPAPLPPPSEAVPAVPAPGGEQPAPGTVEPPVAPPASVPPAQAPMGQVPPGQVPPSHAPAVEEPAPQVPLAMPDVLTGTCLVLVAPVASIAVHPAPVAPPADAGQPIPVGPMPATDPFAQTVPGSPTGDVLVPAGQTPPQGTTAPAEGAAVDQVEFHGVVPNQVLIVILGPTPGTCNALLWSAPGAMAAVAPPTAAGSGATVPEQAIAPAAVPPTAPETTAPVGGTEVGQPAAAEIPSPPVATPSL